MQCRSRKARAKRWVGEARRVVGFWSIRWPSMVAGCPSGSLVRWIAVDSCSEERAGAGMIAP